MYGITAKLTTILPNVLLIVPAVSLTTTYPCFIKNALFIFHCHAGQLFNTKYLVSTRGLAELFKFQSRLGEKEIMGLSVVRGRVPTIFFSITGRRRESQGGCPTVCLDMMYYPS